MFGVEIEGVEQSVQNSVFLMILPLDVLDERGCIFLGRRKLTGNHMKGSHVREAKRSMVQIHAYS
jgi:hypothetical protein